MPKPRLATDVVKDNLTNWIANALNCELFPRDGDSLANLELPDFKSIKFHNALPSEGDETHRIDLVTPTGQSFSVLVRFNGKASND